MSLTRFEQNGIELVINTETGEAFASLAGYSRMSGVDYSTLRKRVQRLKGGDNLELKTAEILTVKGLQAVTLVPANLIFKWAMTETGEAFATQRGYARISGKDQSTISRRCQGDASECIKTAEILTPGGLQGDALIPESF